MNKAIFTTLILAFILISCKEKTETFKLTVKGKVIDYYSGEGISNATIYVKNTIIDPSKEQLRCLNDFDTTCFQEVFKSDSSGNFDKCFWLKKSEFNIIVYDYKIISTDAFHINQDSTVFLNIRAKRFCSLAIMLINKTKQCDTLLLIISSPNMERHEITNFFKIAGSKDTSIVYKQAIPEINCYLSYQLWKNSVLLKSYNITKEIGIIDTAKVTIQY